MCTKLISKITIRVKFLLLENLFSLLLVILVISLTLFLPHQNYNPHLPIDDKVFDAYGSFVGGILAFLSTYILIITLKEQREQANSTLEEQRKQANLALEEQRKQAEGSNVDSIFWGLLQHLQKEIEDLNTLEVKETVKEYEGKSQTTQYTNKDYFEHLRRTLQSSFKHKEKYPDNVKQAKEDYLGVYIHNPRLASYFRLLYRICDFIDRANLKEEKKRDYLKFLRAQLTTSELFLLRYNAQIYEGENFQQYINEYNLLKHLPVFELLEFKYWWGEMENDERSRYEVSAFFDKLRRKIKHLLSDHTEERTEPVLPIMLGEWTVSIDLTSESRLELVAKMKNKRLKGINTLDMAPENLQRLLQCVLAEIFSFSNFQRYWRRDQFMIGGMEKPNKKKVTCYVETEDKSKLRMHP